MGVWSRVSALVALTAACGSSEASQPAGSQAGAGATGGAAGSAGLDANSGASAAGAASGGRAGGSSGSAGGGAPALGGTAGAGGAGNAGNAGSATGGAAGAADRGGSGGVPSSCGTDLAEHPTDSRLRGTYIVTADGPRHWVTWHDGELDFDCTFRLLSDGLYHCAPTETADSSVFYTDPACTEPAYTLAREDDCSLMDYILVSDLEDCENPNRNGLRYYEVGEKIPAGMPFYTLSGGGCTELSGSLGQDLFRRGSEVDYSTKFVTATYGALDASVRVQAYGVSTTDGLRQRMTFHDLELRTDCSLETAEDGARRCLPVGPAPSFYSDASCSTPLATRQLPCDDGPPKYLRTTLAPSCTQSPLGILAAGAAFDGQQYGGTHAYCNALATPTDAYVTSKVPASALEAVNTAIDQSATTRLEPIVATTPDGGCWFDGLWDSELGARCHFATATDGKLRCFPDGGSSFVAAFTDSTCTTPADYAGPIDCGVAQPPKFMTDIGSHTACGGTLEAYRAGDPVASDTLGKIWVSPDGNACVERQLDPGTYLPLTKMDPAELVEGELVTD